MGKVKGIVFPKQVHNNTQRAAYVAALGEAQRSSVECGHGYVFAVNNTEIVSANPSTLGALIKAHGLSKLIRLADVHA